jgi:hypothetical protein
MLRPDSAAGEAMRYIFGAADLYARHILAAYNATGGFTQSRFGGNQNNVVNFVLGNFNERVERIFC